MMVLSDSIAGRTREVLFALRDRARGDSWIQNVECGLRPAGIVAIWMSMGEESVRRVEQGGLAGAVLCADGSKVEGFSLLRVIRSINVDLPCWFVTDDPTPDTLRVAFSLRVNSVITHPVEAETISLELTRGLG